MLPTRYFVTLIRQDVCYILIATTDLQTYKYAQQANSFPQVDLPLDFSVVNVRWEADGSERDAKIEQYLPQCTFDLRYVAVSESSL